MRLRRIVLVAVMALVALAAVPVAGANPTETGAPVAVHVSPGTGGPRTAFKVSWRNRTDIGMVGTLHRSETVQINGPQHGRCVASGGMGVPTTTAGQLVRVSLTPGRMSTTGSRTWCTGTFHGAVVEDERFTCAPPHLCPQIAIRPMTIAHFSFKVRRRG
ncbi:MAG TPA: hypothetical protein VGF68_17480 [Solirubrobacteraceae bacterium]|jgi:hypothetical protein